MGCNTEGKVALHPGIFSLCIVQSILTLSLKLIYQEEQLAKRREKKISRGNMERSLSLPPFPYPRGENRSTLCLVTMRPNDKASPLKQWYILMEKKQT